MPRDEHGAGGRTGAASAGEAQQRCRHIARAPYDAGCEIRELAERSAHLGCDSVCVGAAAAADRYAGVAGYDVAALADRCRRSGIDVLIELRLDRLAADVSIVAAEPNWFSGADGLDVPVDPRAAPPPHNVAARLDLPAAASGLARWYAAQLAPLLDAGVSGFVVHWPQRLLPAFTQALFAALRAQRADIVLIAWTPGATAPERRRLAGARYDACVCSLPWWDFRAPWFAEEWADLGRIGRVLAPVAGAAGSEHDTRLLQRALDFAAECADGMVIDMPRAATTDAAQRIAAGSRVPRRPHAARAWRTVSAPWARVVAWYDALSGAVVLVNSDADRHSAVPAAEIAAHAAMGGLDAALPDTLAPAEVRRIEWQAPAPAPAAPAALAHALAAPRIVIERVTPSVDAGRFAAKCTVGDMVVAAADVYADGHPMLSVHLLWREAGAADWQRTRMKALGNDRWSAAFGAARLGRYEFSIEAGLDAFGSFRSDLSKKFAAGQATALDAAEGRLLIDAAARAAPEPLRARLLALARDVATAERPIDLLLAAGSSALVDAALAPAFATRAATFAIDVERRAARHGAWYELFPRSQGRGGHGTFEDVVAQLPRIAAMGFDVLYFPPIHPIGISQRKGRNNALSAAPGDPGSAYAIGSADGGHDAIHPQLGTLDDFRALVAAAARYGIEIALDFAVQCSPDHPWIRQHPHWFDWRPDGSLRHAENPPKKYEDIVNVDFYNAADGAGLWRALRDIVTFWVAQGVRIFRVDNPHTKPLPFWEWLIAEVRARDPAVIFLSEAFTRPKPMYRLAKLGFSQSYTYFTWRNTRAELESYLTELTAEPLCWFFRPNFFVNTPDINPYFLQTSGRAGFLIRAALAATLSGLWGLYSGFELCEAAALPGREEYLDSEKYELRPRDWNAPGNISAEIAALNRIRRANPALQTHLGITFYACSNDQVLYFAKATPSRDNVVLVAICLDPHHAHDASIELPLWEWGLPDDGALQAEDLLRGSEFCWRGKRQLLRFEPAAPYRLWRLRREETPA